MQGVLAALLLGFIWPRLVSHFGAAVRKVPVAELRALVERELAGWTLFWPAAVAGWQVWPSVLLADLRDLWTQLGQAMRDWSSFPSFGFTLWQVVAVILAAATMWAIANVVLVRLSKGPQGVLDE